MPGDAAITVLLVDDHPLYRAGLREVLEEAQLHVVAEAATGEEAIRQALRTRPNVVVMDVRLPSIDGISATREIRRALPDTEVLLMTGAPEDQAQLLRAIEAGARSYIGKDQPGDIIVEAVRCAANRTVYLTPEITKLLLAGFAQPNRQRGVPGSSEGLTERERATLRLLAEGRRVREIAAELEVSPRTVGNHISAIYRKLHLQHRADAVVYAVKQGLVSLGGLAASP